MTGATRDGAGGGGGEVSAAWRAASTGGLRCGIGRSGGGGGGGEEGAQTAVAASGASGAWRGGGRGGKGGGHGGGRGAILDKLLVILAVWLQTAGYCWFGQTLLPWCAIILVRSSSGLWRPVGTGNQCIKLTCA
jgi:hypothetical protein